MELWQIPPEILERYLVRGDPQLSRSLGERSHLGRVLPVLGEVLEEWLALKLKDVDTDIPVVEGINFFSYA